MNLWLDDKRIAPDGWVWVKTAADAIAALKVCQFETISLDHDLGDEEGPTGYSVLCWIEEEIVNPTFKFRCPKILVHSANPVGMRRMRQAIESIDRLLNAI